MTTTTFTFRQLEADPTLCAGMKRLWQDSEGKTVTYQVQDEEKAVFVLNPIPKEHQTKGPVVDVSGMPVIIVGASTPKPKAKGKKK